MKTKFIKTLTLTIANMINLSMFFPTLAAGISDADLCDSSLPPSVLEANGCKGTEDNLPIVVINILNAIITVLGLVAVVVIIYGGIQMTSTGDAGKVKKAKDTILYAVIGLIVCVLAFAIVNFVIKNFL